MPRVSRSAAIPALAGIAVAASFGLWSLGASKRSAALDTKTLAERAEWFNNEGILAFMAINDGLPKCSGALKAKAVSVFPDPATRSISFDVACENKLDFGPVEMKRLTRARVCAAYADTVLAREGVVLKPRLTELGKVVSSPFLIGPEVCG